jgi:hypothetical protein
MLTLGAAPNDPVAVTDEFTPVADEEADDAEDEELAFDEPQPARTTQASKGMAMIARKRRMKNLNVVDVSFVSLLASPSGGVAHRAAFS